MKTGFQIAWIAILLVGCSAPSKYKNDPRAAVVGPDFLDDIELYPMDHDTQYFYPHFGLTQAKPLETSSVQGSSTFPPNLSALMIERPKPAPAVSEIEGKGWPQLEHDGIPFEFQ
jgi:hypothetical protein